MEVDVRQAARVLGQCERVLTDEVPGVVGEAVHRVARADALVAVGVAHADDGDRELGARLRIP